MKLLASILAIAALALAAIAVAGCGGGDPSQLAPYEIGLVGVYELESYETGGVFYDEASQATIGWAGELWLYDNNECHRIFFVKDVRLDDAWSEWSATLTTITYEGDIGIWETDKPNGIGVDIGGLLTIIKDDLETGVVRTDYWRKIDMPPRGLPSR